jgi:CheY-like chemotaxis protein
MWLSSFCDIACRSYMTYGPAFWADNLAMTNTKGMLFSGERGEPSKAPRSLRIVVADDDRDAALTLMMLLRDEGHEVRSVHSGRQVMGVVLDFDPDVVMLDIQMPGPSGWEVARTIRSQRELRQPLLIGISGEYKKGADKVLAQIIGFDHYLVKPYDPNALLALLAPLRLPQAGA